MHAYSKGIIHAHETLIVADFSVHASVPSAQLSLEDTVVNTKGKRKKGGDKIRNGPQVVPVAT